MTDWWRDNAAGIPVNGWVILYNTCQRMTSKGYHLASVATAIIPSQPRTVCASNYLRL